MVSRKATKDKKLLSFADDEEDDEDGGGSGGEQKRGTSSGGGNGVVVKLRMHSSHDSKYKDKKLSSKVPKMPKSLASMQMKCHIC
jgi:hypothetical protein